MFIAGQRSGGMTMEQFNFLLTSSIPCLGVARNHSLWSFLIPYFRNLMIFGSSVSIFVSQDFWISSLSLRLGNQFFSLGNPSSSLIDTHEGPLIFPSPSLFDRRLGSKFISFSNLDVFFGQFGSGASEAILLLACLKGLGKQGFTRLVFRDRKLTLGGRKSLGIKPSGSNKSIASDIMNCICS